MRLLILYCSREGCLYLYLTCLLQFVFRRLKLLIVSTLLDKRLLRLGLHPTTRLSFIRACITVVLSPILKPIHQSLLPHFNPSLCKQHMQQFLLFNPLMILCVLSGRDYPRLFLHRFLKYFPCDTLLREFN